MIRKMVRPVVLYAREERVDFIEDLDRLHIYLSISVKGFEKSGCLALPAVVKSEVEDMLTNLWWEHSEEVAGLDVLCWRDHDSGVHDYVVMIDTFEVRCVICFEDENVVGGMFCGYQSSEFGNAM
jgi:hypothetical protein